MYESAVTHFHIPDAVASAMAILALCLALVPFFAGRKLGPLDIPNFTPPRRRLIGLGGVAFLALVLIAYQPLWAVPPASLSNCGFFGDEFTSTNGWRSYDPVIDSGRRVWVACQVEAREDLEIAAVETAAGLADQFFVGYLDQERVDVVHLAKGASKRISIVLEPQPSNAHLRQFTVRSKWSLRMADGRPDCSSQLASLVLPQ